MEKLWKVAIENSKIVLVIDEAFETYGGELSTSRVGHFNPRERSLCFSE
jgi:hypothetical protein